MTAPIQPIHLRPTAPLAERALLPGDPGRALALAQLLLDQPRMFNHHRGLWGYTGRASDGEPLTIQSTGMGGPSAAIVLHELIALGVRRAIRVGTCGALSPKLALGDLVVALDAVPTDGTSRALGAHQTVPADPRLTEALLDRLQRLDGGSGAPSPMRPHHSGRIASTDLFYDPAGDTGRVWSAAGAIAVEMEAAALFALAARSGAQVGCLLAVSDLLHADGARTRIDDRALMQAAEAMGAVATAALAPSPPASR